MRIFCGGLIEVTGEFDGMEKTRKPGKTKSLSSVIILSVRDDHQLNRSNFLFQTFVFVTLEARNNRAVNFRIAAAGAAWLTFFV